jgi:hypothetical protein
MNNKEIKNNSPLSRREVLKILSLAGGAASLWFLSQGIEEALKQPTPPDDVLLPNYLQETSTPTARTNDELNPDESPTPTSEPEPTRVELSFDPETDTKIGEISLREPFVMDIPAETGFTAGWGSLRFDVIPWFMFGKTWNDEQNAEGVNYYNDFYLGTKDALVVMAANHEQVLEHSFVMLMHSYSYNEEMLSGDWGRAAVINHINHEPGRNVIGKPISFYQENVPPQDLVAINAATVEAEAFNESFKYWEQYDHPMVCDLASLGIPSLGPNQIHLIACEGGPTDRTANRYVLSFEATSLASVFNKLKA